MEGNRELWCADMGLDLVQSITFPSAAFKAMWKETAVDHNLITEENGGERLMKELTDGLQGGISVCFQPQATANNPMVLPSKCELEECEFIHQYARKYNKPPRMDDVSQEALQKYFCWAVKNGYDHFAPRTWLTYVDATSLYPWAMTKYLPTG